MSYKCDILQIRQLRCRTRGTVFTTKYDTGSNNYTIIINECKLSREVDQTVIDLDLRLSPFLVWLLYFTRVGKCDLVIRMS